MLRHVSLIRSENRKLQRKFYPLQGIWKYLYGLTNERWEMAAKFFRFEFEFGVQSNAILELDSLIDFSF